MTSLVHYAKAKLKQALVPVIYRYPPFALAPERLAVYLNGLLDRMNVPGDIGEIGCNLGGTAIIAAKMLQRSGWSGRYICYDTFGGFVDEQFAVDVGRGTEPWRKDMFSANSIGLVRKILTHHDCRNVTLVAGDITTIPDSALSDRYAAILLDIDLSEPTYEALRRFWPRLTPGGAIFVDDCPEGHVWKARLGYQRFCRDFGLPEIYRHGLGILQKLAESKRSLAS